ncbi:MAG: alpha-galactosidase [Clostridia bacterium]|nr:alpha-galactosidase [Clostridia bacterium]
MIKNLNDDTLLEAFADEKGVELYRIPGVGKYSWVEPLKNAAGTWYPMGGRDHSLRQWWFPNTEESVFEAGAPVMCVFDYEDKNVITVSLSDSFKRTKISASVDDLGQRDEILLTVEIVDDGLFQQEDHEIIMRVDRRKKEYYETVSEACDWMRSFLKGLIRIPEAARVPLYSSWYNFHQEPDQELLTEELREASKMGFKTVILDDGWQFEGETTKDYYKCGDWHIALDKFPDFKKFVDDVHSFGMKLMVWFPVPFAGFATEDYKRFKDKMAFDIDSMRAGVYDVRYKELRDYISGTYEHFVDTYGFDGLKLDFVDAWGTITDLAPKNDEMDHERLFDAVRTLMDEIYEKMTARDPDFLFEFRQVYVGAEIVNHCNMLRVADCAADSVTNRIGIGTLRIVDGATAIHSDMLLWGKQETPVNCMRQMLNIMFSVPQISVLLTKVPAEQKQAVKRFVDYWSANRDVLLDGKFRAPDPGANYSLMSSEKDGKKITVLYSTTEVALTADTEDVWNNTSKNYIVATGKPGKVYTVFDWSGKKILGGTVRGNAQKIEVPAGGLAVFANA